MSESDISLCWQAYYEIQSANNFGTPTKIAIEVRKLKKNNPTYKKLKLGVFYNLFRINTKRLYRKCANLKAGFDYDHRNQLRYLFTEAEELEIVNTIISRSEKHDCLTRSEIRDIATGIITKKCEICS